VLSVLALMVIALLLLLLPGDLLDKADRIGYAVCHQIPTRTYFFGGRPLPLCARCSGTYLGGLSGIWLILVLGRTRSHRWPPPGVLLVLLSFLFLWGVDGLNSFLTFFPGLPHLYETRNILRLITGTMEGLTLVALITPFFNVTLWRHTTKDRTIRNGRELVVWLLMGAGVILAVQSQWETLLYPLALFSGLGVVTMMTLVNTMIVTIASRRDGLAERWHQAVPLLLAGTALSLLELVVIGVGRALLTQALRLPF